MLNFSDAGIKPALTVNQEMVKAYILALFGNEEEGWVEFRGIHDKDKSITPRVEFASLADWGSAGALACKLAEQWGREGRALFVCPAVLKQRGKATMDNLSHFTTVVVDLDEGDTVAKRDKLQAVLGSPLMVVNSGGTTSAGHPKQHVYWALSEAEDDITRITILRGRMARYVGDDESFGRRATQIIRVAGSLHQKGEPKLVELVERNLGGAGVHHLMDLEESLPHSLAPAAPPPGLMDFSQAVPTGTEVSRRELQGMTVEAGGQGVATRYDAFTKVAGGIIRDNDQDLPLAYEMVSAWVSAKMSPPWDEKRMRQEFDALSRKHNENYPDGASPEIEWPENPVDPRKAAKVPPMPEDMLPDTLREWLVDASRAASVPLEMVAAPAMSAIGLLLSGKVATNPDPKNSEYVVYPNIWSVIVAPPSGRKTIALKLATKPLAMLDTERERKRTVAEDEADTLRQLSIAVKASAVADGEGKAVKIQQIGSDMRKKMISRDEAVKRIKDIKSGADGDDDDEPAVPTVHTYMAGDINSAAMGVRCQTGPVMVKRDELSGLLTTFGEDGNTIRQMLLEGHAGDGDAIIDRIGRGHMHIKNIKIGVCGGIQPGPWSVFVNQAKGQAAGTIAGGGADGFMQRFQLAVTLPDGSDPVPHRTNIVHRENVMRLLERIDNATGLHASMLFMYNQMVDGVTRIPFGKKAAELMASWGSENRRKYVSNHDVPPHMQGHYGKYDKLVAGLALIFHTLGCAAGQMMPDVTERHVKLAIRWCDYMRLHAEAIYRDPTPSKLLDKIAKGRVVDGMRTSEVYRMGGTGIRTADDLSEAAEHMPDLMRIVREKGSKGGRPSVTLRLHPHIMEILK